ncbi:P1 family peptidase [uncultured Veillonella sp.]|uniref:P1 family peptidase n=1 Tax=uncultured Veillonella sp. TaxID=159268 RepID=UPI0026179A5B|nr:P1 family peptidase [uncultured Veillonella sp.]
MSEHRIRDFPVSLGYLRTGPKNSIADVPGVRVGHKTVNKGAIRTGVTVIMPGDDNPFINKYTAAAFVQNGFGKSVGLMQIEELGTLETPIALTNTLNVGKVSDALNAYIIEETKAKGTMARSINPVVGECNDSVLHDIQQRCIGYDEVMDAINDVSEDFAQGDVGAGRSTICFGFKGGIGSASRVITVGQNEGGTSSQSEDVETSYTIGVLVQSNFGATKDFVLNGESLGRWWMNQGQVNGGTQREGRGQMTGTGQKAHRQSDDEWAYSESDQGSIMVIVATDLPVNSRQLKRIIKRAGVGIMRTGAYVGHGSGEVMIGFTTANRVPHEGPLFNTQQIIRDSALNPAFLGVAEATYEAILNSLVAAEGAMTQEGKRYESLCEVLNLYMSCETDTNI